MNNEPSLCREDAQNSEGWKIPITLFTNELTFDKVRTPSHVPVDDLQPKVRISDICQDTDEELRGDRGSD